MDFDAIPLAMFRDDAFIPEQPLVMRSSPGSVAERRSLPAFGKWFETAGTGRTPHVRKVLSKTMQPALTKVFPFELEYPQRSPTGTDAVKTFIECLKSSGESGTPSLEAALGHYLEAQLPANHASVEDRHFVRFDAPLALLDTAVRMNETGRLGPVLRRLYIGQAPLSGLPEELQADVPVPELVRRAGRGDVYNSSVWLGLEPTYTPLHRDPNPNLFVQLCSEKVVRLLPPKQGVDMYRTIQWRLNPGGPGNPNLRGAEMMEGPEALVLFKTIWGGEGEGWGLGSSSSEDMETQELIEQELFRRRLKEGMLETRLSPGDALFIPKGWWHSVRSPFWDGRLNGSVNWWFR